MRRLRGDITLVRLFAIIINVLLKSDFFAPDSARNPLERNSRIDLHGLRPREAFVRAERALVKAIKEGRKSLYLIVGQGRHSINGKPVLKKTVQNEIIRFGFIHFIQILFLLMIKPLQKWISVRG
jgi:hypothetical protein